MTKYLSRCQKDCLIPKWLKDTKGKISKKAKTKLFIKILGWTIDVKYEMPYPKMSKNRMST